MTYRGHARKGIVVLDEPVPLPESSAVEIAVLETPHAQIDGNQDPMPAERLVPVIGKADGSRPTLRSTMTTISTVHQGDDAKEVKAGESRQGERLWARHAQ